MYVWNTASEMKVPLKRIGGGGVQLVSWSPQGSAVLAATTSAGNIINRYSSEGFKEAHFSLQDLEYKRYVEAREVEHFVRPH